jgi:hypothetical protein
MVIPTAAIATSTVRSREERQREEEEKSKRREIRPKRGPVEKAGLHSETAMRMLAAGKL